jgi:hypothetical protein
MFQKAPRILFGVTIVAALLVAAVAPAAAATTTWYTGQRAFGQVTVEPAIDDANGQQVFLLTPNKAPFPSKAPDAAQAPLYLVAYPTNSTITEPFNCTPTTCDHVASVPVPWYPSGGLLKGHDHLVGIASTGGAWNVAWDVELDIFTPKGFEDGAINQRIMTLAALNDAKANGDIAAIDTGIVFNCSSVGAATYLKATPLNFSV